jgi:vitamin B12 transporter
VDQILAHIGLNFDHVTGDIEWAHSAGLQLTDDASTSFSAGVRSARSLGQRLQGHYEATTRWESGELAHRLTGLAEIERDRTKNDGGPGSLANQRRILETRAFAIDYGLGRGPLDLTVSARHEQNTTFADATTWRVGGVWAFDRLDARLRLSGGEGVKNPGVFELFGFFPAYFVGNPDLSPEQSRGWELGWEQSFADDRGAWSAVWFQSILQDEIYTDFSGFPATARNATTDSDRQGIEVEGRWDATDAFRAFGSATFLESQQNGAPEIRRPEVLASVTLDWRPVGRPWSVSMTADHTGDQTDTDFGSFLPVTLGAYTLVGGQARWQLNDGVDVYIRGENLLDEDYQDVFGFHTQGRGLYLGVRLSHS